MLEPCGGLATVAWRRDPLCTCAATAPSPPWDRCTPPDQLSVSRQQLCLSDQLCNRSVPSVPGSLTGPSPLSRQAAILQQTSDFIYSLEQEKTRLLTQNCQLKRLLGQQQASDSDAASATDSPASAHRNASRESAEAVAPAEEPPLQPPPPPPPPVMAEPVVTAQEEEEAVAIRQELAELRAQLEQERRHRLLTEDRLRLAEVPAPPPPPPAPAAVYQERLHPGHVPIAKKPKMEAVEPKPEPAASPLPGMATGLGMEPQTVLPAILLAETAGLQQPPPTEPPPPPPPPAVHPPHR